jgi:hypothetical protein
MRGKASLFLVILGFSQLVPAASTTRASEELDTKLNKPLTNYSLGVTNFVEALIHVSSEFQIPLGIAWLNDPAARTERSFAWKQATVKDVIESIVKTEPDYRVEIRNDIVRVIPLGLVPERQNFLKVKIKEFEVVNGYTDLAILKLRGIIGSQKHSGFSIGAEPGEPKITIKLRNATVADIMDALAYRSTRKIWIVTFSTDPNPTALGFRRTLTPWNGFTPLPEEGEPALNFLHWGDKIPWRAGGTALTGR